MQVVAPAVRFVEVTADSGVGIAFHPDEDPGACLVAIEPSQFGGFCTPELMAGAVAVGDYDRDGWPDLYVPRLEAPDLLLRNTGDGRFRDVAATAGLGAPQNSIAASWLDVDNDGDLDLMVLSFAKERYHLYLNAGDGTFSEDAVARGVAQDNGSMHVGFGVTVGDYDRDGWLDMFLSEWRPGGLVEVGEASNAVLLRNRGDAAPGHFEDRTAAAGLDFVPAHRSVFLFGATFSDFDADGWPDLAIAGDFGTSRLFWNRGDGTFLDGSSAAGIISVENAMGSTVADFDGDGWLDWFVTSVADPNDTCDDPDAELCNWRHSGNRLFRYAGGRIFEDLTDAAGVREGGWGWGAAWWDPDNDGDLDLVMTAGWEVWWLEIEDPFNVAPLRFWRNDGSGAMTEEAAAVGLDTVVMGRGLVVVDYDRDGDQDLLVVDNTSTPRLFRNDGNANHWLRVDVRQGAQGRPSLGAEVWLRRGPEDAPALRVIGTGTHFLGQSEGVAHFGLGASDAPVAEIRVRWPDTGAEKVLTDVAPNQELLIAR